MKYVVSKTSLTGNGGKPCAEAKREKKVWAIELNDLKGLLEFKDKYGDIVILKSSCTDIPYEIEIYNDYRE